MKVLLTFAVEPEFAPLRKLRQFEEFRIGDVSVYQARIGRATVDVVVTGMGPANAQRAAEAAMSVPHTICICSGFCGALKSEHHVGDILAARVVQQMGKNKTIQCSQGLVTNAWGDGAKHAQRFLSSEKIVATAEEKARLAPFADAVDMESFAILSVAHERKLSAVAIRVVSDRFDQDVPVDFSDDRRRKGKTFESLESSSTLRITLQTFRRLFDWVAKARRLRKGLPIFSRPISRRSHCLPTDGPRRSLSDVASRQAQRAK